MNANKILNLNKNWTWSRMNKRSRSLNYVRRIVVFLNDPTMNEILKKIDLEIDLLLELS